MAKKRKPYAEVNLSNPSIVRDVSEGSATAERLGSGVNPISYSIKAWVQISPSKDPSSLETRYCM